MGKPQPEYTRFSLCGMNGNNFVGQFSLTISENFPNCI